jgi:Ni/Co efflux regulator RcnB
MNGGTNISIDRSILEFSMTASCGIPQNWTSNMRRFLIATAALATLAAPMAASAQSYGEVRQDKRELRQEQKELKHERQRAHRDGVVTNGERRDIQGERRDVRGAQQELRGDRQDMRQSQRFDRSNRTWWQGRQEFAGYTGRRAGYWYAPGYGYRTVAPRYANYSWSRGGYVPYGYRNFYVQDPYFYGLRPAPYGHRWVYADGNLVLMSIATGLIADIMMNAY